MSEVPLESPNPEAAGPTSTAEPARAVCSFCFETIHVDALVCPRCRRHRARPWQARFETSLGSRLLGAGGVALLLALITGWYRSAEQADAMQKESERRLGSSALSLQTSLEQIQMPCLLESDAACAARYSTLIESLSAGFYVWRDDAKRRAAVDGHEAQLAEAIDFLDEFYNPGTTDFANLMAHPLQPTLLENAVFLSRRADTSNDGDGWCGTVGRQQRDKVVTSINVFRFCFGVSRRVLAGLQSFDTPGVSGDLCFSKKPFAERVNAIAGIAGDVSSAAWGAPWLSSGVCR
ncbi:MAG: hypothetical protein ACO1OB_30135 [Archangium sp.]